MIATRPSLGEPEQGNHCPDRPGGAWAQTLAMSIWIGYQLSLMDQSWGRAVPLMSSLSGEVCPHSLEAWPVPTWFRCPRQNWSKLDVF